MENIASIISDVHTSSTDSAWKASDIKGDARWAIQQFVDLSIKKKVLVAIALGDLLDKSSNKAMAVQPWVQAVEQLRANRITFMFIQGNHDFDNPPWLSALCPHAVHMHKRREDVGGFRFYGLDFQPATQLSEELSLVPPGTDFLLCHQGWEEFMGFEGSYQGSLKDVKKVKTVLTGDYHKSQSMTIGNLRVHSLGATSMQEVSDPEEHFVGLLTGDGKISRHKLASRRVIRTPILSFLEESVSSLTLLRKKIIAATREAEAANMPEELCKPLVIVEYQNIQGMEERTRAVIKDTAHLICRRVPRKVAEVSAETVSVDHGRVSLAQEIREELKTTKQDRLLQELLLGMLDSPEPSRYEQQFRVNFLRQE